MSELREATYNPYRYEFVDLETEHPIFEAAVVYLKDKRIFYRK